MLTHAQQVQGLVAQADSTFKEAIEEKLQGLAAELEPTLSSEQKMEEVRKREDVVQLMKKVDRNLAAVKSSTGERGLWVLV